MPHKQNPLRKQTMRTTITTLTCLAAMLFTGIAYAQPAAPIAQDTLLTYLDQLTQWQRDAAAIEPSASGAREIVFRDSLRENAAKTLQNGFTFMRSVASIEPATEQVDPASTRVKLLQTKKDTQTRIALLTSKAAKGTREQLRLEHARLELTETILANLNSASNTSPNKLIYTIESLARSIPELNPQLAKSVAATDAAAPKHSATSILGVAADLFEVTRKQRELSDMVAKTTQIKKDSMELMKALRAGLGEPTPSEESDSDDAASPRVVLTVDQRVEAYKQIGANIVPLGATMRWMDASKKTLQEWGEVLQNTRDNLLSQLVVYVGILLVMLGIPLGLSELSRRALKRVPDIKRKRQLNMVRKIITGVAVVFILMLNFISDFSSFATFAGFLTAGLAVALQSVLLSLVAHFLFYGRYGIRIGDRVHISGVTGEIMKIGMVRFYLRELEETKEGFVATGKTVAFPNSIVFQNSAFYKYA